MSKAKKKQNSREHWEGIAANRKDRREYKKRRKEENEILVQQKLFSHKHQTVPRTVFGNRLALVAPKLLDGDYSKAVERFSAFPHVRPLEEWKPKGKGRMTLFRSLANHLFSKYSTPTFLWTAFFEPETTVCDALSEAVVQIARGESFYGLVKSGDFSVPLTRKMCHNILQSPSSLTFLDAIRRAQVLQAGGDLRLCRTWLTTDPGQRLGGGRWVGNAEDPREYEEFWYTVVRFLTKNPMLDHVQISPLCDYIDHRRHNDVNFSMKGRSANALLASMEEWHGELQVWRGGNSNLVFTESGFRPEEFDLSKKTEGSVGYVPNIWQVDEILTGKSLRKEGKIHHHCVYSYAPSIKRGITSIWSMKHNGNPVLTLEVRKSTNSIVQARGRYNRVPTNSESRVITMWAKHNSLAVRL